MKHGFFSKTLPIEYRQAAWSYIRQVKRCEDQKHELYYRYGARGLTVDYSIEEFVAWWVKNIKTRPKWKRPTCGRVDHDKGYSFDNIEMQECSDNCKEAAQRTRFLKKNKYQRKVMLINKKGEDVILFHSIKSAQSSLKLHNVGRICKGICKQEHGFMFRYYDGGDL